MLGLEEVDTSHSLSLPPELKTEQENGREGMEEKMAVLLRCSPLWLRAGCRASFLNLRVRQTPHPLAGSAGLPCRPRAFAPKRWRAASTDPRHVSG